MIRQLRQDEIDQFMDMTQVAFAVSYTPEELEARSRQIMPEQIWGYYKDDRLAARVAILPLRIQLQGVEFEMGGIAHVATYPELRRGGMVSRLLDRCLEEMKLAGQTVSLLNPFSFAFYRKFGWEWLCDVTAYSVRTANFPRFKETAGQIRRGGAQDLDIVADLYKRYSTRYNGMLVRDPAWWTSTVFKRKLGQLALYSNDNGEPEGYMLYAIRDRRFRIHEWAALTPASRQGLWQFVANHDSIVDQADFSLPADDPTAYWFAEPGTAGREPFPYFMARIVDLEPFLNRYPFEPLPSGRSLLLNVQDDHAPWNTGSWRLAWRPEGGLSVEPLARDKPEEAAPADDTLELKCDIRTLSALLFGSCRPEAMAQLGRLAGSPAAVELLDRAVPRRSAYLLDMF